MTICWSGEHPNQPFANIKEGPALFWRTVCIGQNENNVRKPRRLRAALRHPCFPSTQTGWSSPSPLDSHCLLPVDHLMICSPPHPSHHHLQQKSPTLTQNDHPGMWLNDGKSASFFWIMGRSLSTERKTIQTWEEHVMYKQEAQNHTPRLRSVKPQC